MRTVDADQRENSAKRAGMTFRSEGNERSAQPVPLPVGLPLTPIASVSSEPVKEFVPSPILIELIGIVAARSGHRCARCPNQC